MISAILLLLLGLGILILGAESLVRGGSSLARRMGISPLVIGLTVVAFGTSTPELVVNIFSALRGSADIAIGNIVGSNTANILLILGISALIVPLRVKRSTTWKEIPWALLAIVLVYVFGNDGLFDGVPFNAMSRTDGLALIAIFVIFMYYIVGVAKTEPPINEDNKKIYSRWIAVGLTVAGIGLLYLGGKLLVDQAVILARLAGMSEALIGLTIVAVGTSLPELATSVIAAIRRENDIAIGNIVGSNIFNVFWILGLTSVMLQLPFNPQVNIDVVVCILATLALFLAMFIGKRHELQRWQGGIFLLAYVVYTAYLVLRG